MGIEAAKASSAHLLASSSTQESQQNTDAEDRTERVERMDQNYSKKRIGEGDVKLDLDRLAQAMLDEKKRKSGGIKDEDDRSSKKQKSGLESGSHDVTEEELGIFLVCARCAYFSQIFTEAYRMNRRMTDDPMANYVDAEL